MCCKNKKRRTYFGAPLFVLQTMLLFLPHHHRQIYPLRRTDRCQWRCCIDQCIVRVWSAQQRIEHILPTRIACEVLVGCFQIKIIGIYLRIGSTIRCRLRPIVWRILILWKVERNAMCVRKIDPLLKLVTAIHAIEKLAGRPMFNNQPGSCSITR